MSTFAYRILIVDDDPSLRHLGKQMLERQGYEDLCAEDGFEGLAALKQSLPDIIISDLRMPNMNGFEFLSVVRRRFPMIPSGQSERTDCRRRRPIAESVVLPSTARSGESVTSLVREPHRIVRSAPACEDTTPNTGSSAHLVKLVLPYIW